MNASHIDRALQAVAAVDAAAAGVGAVAAGNVFAAYDKTGTQVMRPSHGPHNNMHCKHSTQDHIDMV